MNISAKTEYACIAVLELSLSYGSGKPVRVREIAGTHGIPSRFLVQILLQLKAAGLVGSTRGAAGGYQLVRDPEEITLAEVMAVCDGPMIEPVSSAGEESPLSKALLGVWKEVTAAQRGILESITFAQLVEQARNATDNMYYI